MDLCLCILQSFPPIFPFSLICLFFIFRVYLIWIVLSRFLALSAASGVLPSRPLFIKPKSLPSGLFQPSILQTHLLDDPPLVMAWTLNSLRGFSTWSKPQSHLVTYTGALLPNRSHRIHQRRDVWSNNLLPKPPLIPYPCSFAYCLLDAGSITGLSLFFHTSDILGFCDFGFLRVPSLPLSPFVHVDQDCWLHNDHVENIWFACVCRPKLVVLSLGLLRSLASSSQTCPGNAFSPCPRIW